MTLCKNVKKSKINVNVLTCFLQDLEAIHPTTEVMGVLAFIYKNDAREPRGLAPWLVSSTYDNL